MRKPQTAKSTIKNDPFESVIPISTEMEIGEPIETNEVMTEPQKPQRIKRIVHLDRQGIVKTEIKHGKHKLTVHLAAELAERVKNAAYWNPKLTIAGIAEQGIKHAIEKFERENGGRYPQRDGELNGGRPIK